MNSILRIYVLSTLNVAAQYIEVLTVTLNLTPNISKQPTLHDQVHYFLRIKSSHKSHTMHLMDYMIMSKYSCYHSDNNKTNLLITILSHTSCHT